MLHPVGQKRHGVRRYAPQLEFLEGRLCPSAIRIVGHTMFVKGDAHTTAITVTDDGAGNVAATVTDSSHSISGTGAGINQVLVDSGPAGDTVSFSLTGALGSDLTLLVHLGYGNDTANLDFSAGMANGTLNVGVGAGPGTDQVNTTFGTITNETVHFGEALGAGTNSTSLHFGGAITTSTVAAAILGGKGADAITANLGSVTDSAVSLYAALGRGADSFTGTLGGNISGKSRVGLHVVGSYGPDCITVHAGGGINISQNSVVYLNLRGGAGTDTISVDYEGVLSGKLNVETWGGSGPDTISQNLTVDAGSTGKLIAHEGGILGANNLTLNVFDNSGTPSNLADLDAIVFANHRDTITKTPNAKVIFVP
jgi:hypothetical protein